MTGKGGDVVRDRNEFNSLLEEAGIVFIKYPVSGVYPYLPSGARMLSRLRERLERLLEERGHEPILFPSLIPLTLFKREIDFFKGFSPEALLAERTLSGRRLDEPLVLRPTSEVPIYYVLSQIVNSWQQLPLKVYQTVVVYRTETKATAPLFRLREVTGFNEAHALARDAEEASEVFKEAMSTYTEFLKGFGIPFLIVESPPWDLFPGAVRNVDYVTIMPDGKLVELASVIDLGDKFARAFEITYQDRDGRNKFVRQVTYGIGLDRVLGTLLWLAADGRGLTIHPDVAPTHTVVIPIYYGKEALETILKYVDDEVMPALKELGLKYVIDLRERTPGYKYYYWERMGVPVRIEVGVKEVDRGSVTIFRRDSMRRSEARAEELREELRKALDEVRRGVAERMRVRAEELLNENTLLLDMDLDRGECLRIEEERGLSTMGRVIEAHGLPADAVGKVLFGRKY